MQYIISYDITENEIRNEIASVLISKGFLRFQYSAYIGETSKPKLKEIIERLKEIIADATGVINIFQQCKTCLNKQIEILPEPEKSDQSKEEKTIDPKNEDQNEIAFIFPNLTPHIVKTTTVETYWKHNPLKPFSIKLNTIKKEKGKRRKSTIILEVTTGVILCDKC